MSSFTPNTPMSASAAEETAAGVAQLFRKTLGVRVSAGGRALDEAALLDKPIGFFELDSLALMEFVMALEERHGIELDEEQVNRCATLRELAVLVSEAKGV